MCDLNINKAIIVCSVIVTQHGQSMIIIDNYWNPLPRSYHEFNCSQKPHRPPPPPPNVQLITHSRSKTQHFHYIPGFLHRKKRILKIFYRFLVNLTKILKKHDAINRQKLYKMLLRNATPKCLHNTKTLQHGTGWPTAVGRFSKK